MNTLIVAIGVTIAVLSLLVCMVPTAPLRAFDDRARLPLLRVFGSGLRIAMGVALVLGAAHTRYPVALQIIGGLLILVGATFLLMSEARFERILQRVLGFLSPSRIRLAALLSLALGLFIAGSAIGDAA